MQKVKEIQFFNQHFYKLISTSGWPTIQIDGIQMHRISKLTPELDAAKKVDTLNPIPRSLVLDICTGLGYTTIFLLKRNCGVITIEKDENVLYIARQNPYSKPLFDNLVEDMFPQAGKVKLIIGDAKDVIKTFQDNFFGYILHDPPRFNIAESLYSKEFYIQLHRILKPKGRILHYIGSPQVKSRYKNIISNIIRRLKEVGFKKIQPISEIECFIIEK
ncbi:MAG: MnmC family methyltransferase [Endomicrobia bacterium]|nr:MnmC family methyltransferase [Endomicrobiia bacterium]